MSKQKSKEHVALESILGSKVVSFHPDFSNAFGSLAAGILLSQGFFWQYKSAYKDNESIIIDGKPFFSRTISEWQEETSLSEEQQRAARKVLCEFGVLHEKKAGMPAKMYFHFDFDGLVAVIYRYKETGLPVTVDYRHKKREYPRTSSGKIRRQVAVINGDTYKEREFNESYGEEGEREPPSLPETFPLEEKEKKEKIPGGGAAAAARYDHQVFHQSQASDTIQILDGIAEIRNDHNMRAAFTMVRRVPANLFDSYLSDFALTKAGVNGEEVSRKDLREHFLNHSAKRYESEQKQQAASIATGTAYAPVDKASKTPAFVK